MYIIIEGTALAYVYLGDTTTLQSDSAEQVQANTEITVDLSYFV